MIVDKWSESVCPNDDADGIFKVDIDHWAHNVLWIVLMMEIGRLTLRGVTCDENHIMKLLGFRMANMLPAQQNINIQNDEFFPPLKIIELFEIVF